MRNMLSLVAEEPDLESLVLALVSIFLSRLFSTVSTSPLFYLSSSFLSLTPNMIVGMKLALWLHRKTRARASSIDRPLGYIKGRSPVRPIAEPRKRASGVLIAYTPILGLGFIYLVWMITATFSNLAPLVTISATLLCIVIPPRLQVAKSFKRLAYSIYVEIRQSRLLMIILIAQLVGMAYVALAMIAAGSSGSNWMNTIWEGLSVDVLLTISVVVFLTALSGIALNASRSFLLQSALTTVWIRSFMIFRGFVWTGGDAGEHVAVAKYLLSGGIAPFVDPFVHESVVANWRYGSFSTLFFNSNYAFSSFLAGFSPDAAASALAVAFSSTLLIFGSYALSTGIFKSGKARRICFLLLLLNTVDFFWQFRSDPNSFTHAVYPAYLASVVLTPLSFFGVSCVLLGSFLTWAMHPAMIILIAPALAYFIASYLRRFGRSTLLRISVLLISVAILFLFLVVYDPSHSLMRTLSLQHLFYPRPGTSEGFAVGNHILKSSFISYYLARYYAGQVVFIFLGAISCLVLCLRTRLSLHLDTNVRRFAIVSILTIITVLVLDFFLDPSSLTVTWRLWPLVVYLLLPSLPALLLAFTEIPVLANVEAGLHKIKKSVAKISIYVVLCMFLMNITTTMTYNSGNSLNFDTLSVEEYRLLLSFVSTVDLNDTIILAESPTFRYILAITGDWLPSTPTYYSRYHDLPALWYYQSGKERLHAFADLVYLGNAEDALRIAVEENVSTVHVVVLNRLSGPKPSWWMKTPYINTDEFGERILENHAGYILEIRSSLTLPISSWSMKPNKAKRQDANGNSMIAPADDVIERLLVHDFVTS